MKTMTRLILITGLSVLFALKLEAATPTTNHLYSEFLHSSGELTDEQIVQYVYSLGLTPLEVIQFENSENVDVICRENAIVRLTIKDGIIIITEQIPID